MTTNMQGILAMEKNQIKNNVSVFSRDVAETGSYAYTGDKLSSALANERITQAMVAIYSLHGKRILDLGCGDGTYSLELVKRGAAALVGIDPSEAAVAAASAKAKEAGLEDKMKFITGNIYELSLSEKFDCIVLRGVLHHLPDAGRALQAVASLADNVLLMEPNGTNPVLKIIEKTSRYHIEHEEQSFTLRTITKWLNNAGFPFVRCDHTNLVPMFCPDWMARVCKVVEPLVEALPLIRNIACGQYIIRASRDDF
jgi:2-polyprenyl-3-methyl-5-hydroxy-6-metoxy-1,4-benzoquinol methylase